MNYCTYLNEIDKIKEKRVSLFTDKIRNSETYKKLHTHNAELTDAEQNLKRLVDEFDNLLFEATMVSRGEEENFNPNFEDTIDKMNNAVRMIEEQICVVFNT